MAHFTFIPGFAFNNKVWQPVLDVLVNEYGAELVELYNKIPPSRYRAPTSFCKGDNSAIIRDKKYDSKEKDEVKDIAVDDKFTHFVKGDRRTIARRGDFTPLERFKTTLIGWSLGGVFAAEYALQHPEQVEKLILVNCAYQFDQQLLAEFPANLAQNSKKTIDNFVLMIAKSSNQNNYKTLYSFLKKSGLCYDYKQLQPLIIKLSQYNLHNIIPQISCPVLHIIADNDPLCPVEPYKHTANTVIMPQAGHACFLANPTKFVELII